jgi:hypothetical protein
MRNIDIEALTIDNLLGWFLALLANFFILLLGTLRDNQLMAAFVNDASAD